MLPVMAKVGDHGYDTALAEPDGEGNITPDFLGGIDRVDAFTHVRYLLGGAGAATTLLLAPAPMVAAPILLGANLYYLRRPSPHGPEASLYGLDSARAYPLRSVPIGSKPVFMVLILYTLICMNCGARWQESRDIADPRKSYTRAFARLVLELAEKMTILDIARYLRVGWDLVKSIIKTPIPNF